MSTRFIFFTLFLLNGARCQRTTTEQPRELAFTIDKTWNGVPVLHNETVNIFLSGDETSKDVTMRIDAPFYDDPSPTEARGKPVVGLWNYEVVQVFFLNSDNQYLEVEVGPYGQHIVLLMDGERHTIRHSLPLNLTTSIEGSRWVAEADIFAHYFPPQVTKFNAYALNGVGSDRQYLALYPANDSTTEPDLHNLGIFQPIDFGILNSLDQDTTFSPIWKAAMDGIFTYKISRQWNNFRTNIAPSTATLQGFEGGVEINYTIPTNEKPYPSEALVIVFENDDGESTKLRLHVDGSYFIDLLVDRKAKINAENLALDYRLDLRDTEYVRGSALVPPSYFSPKVKTINIYVLFGVESMIAMSLQPITLQGNVAFKPDLNSIKHFAPIDFDLLVQSNVEYSPLWREMLGLPLDLKEELVTTTVLPEYQEETSTQEITTLPSEVLDTTPSVDSIPETHRHEVEETEATTEQPQIEIETILEQVLNNAGTTEKEQDVKDMVGKGKEGVSEAQTQTTETPEILETTETPKTQREPVSQTEDRPEDSSKVTQTAEETAHVGTPDGGQNLKGVTGSPSELDKPLRFLLKRRNTPPKREDSPRRYEDSKSDQNEVPISFQIDLNPKEKEASPRFPPRVAPEVKLDKEFEEDYPLDEEEEGTGVVDYVSGLLPPPHPICFTEGLIPDSFRCQVFYECVIEDGKWEVYRWRCKRGFYYDSETVACLRGIC